MPDYFDRLLARSVPGYPLPPGDVVVSPWLPQVFEQVSPEPEQCEPAAPPDPVTPRTPGTPGPTGPRGPSGEQPGVASSAVQVSRPEPVPAALRLVPVPESRTFTTSERTTHEVLREQPVGQRLTTVAMTVHQSARIAELEPSHTTAIAPVQYVEPRRVTVTQRAEAHQPQVVHVSIGRVEVTAAAPQHKQAARTATRRPDPAMSLERYLAREDDRR